MLWPVVVVVFVAGSYMRGSFASAENKYGCSSTGTNEFSFGANPKHIQWIPAEVKNDKITSQRRQKDADFNKSHVSGIVCYKHVSFEYRANKNRHGLASFIFVRIQFHFFSNNDLFSVWFAREVSFLWRLRRIDVVDSIRTKSKRRNLRGKRLWWVLLAKTDCKLIFRWRNFVYKLWSWPSWMAQAIFRWLFWLQLFVALLLLCSSPLFDDFVAMVVVVFVASPVERKRTAAKFNMKMQ